MMSEITKNNKLLEATLSSPEVMRLLNQRSEAVKHEEKKVEKIEEKVNDGLEELTEEELLQVLQNALADKERGLGNEPLNFPLELQK